MSDIDTAAFRREWAGCNGVAVPAEPDDSCFSCVVLTLCDEIDDLRNAVAELKESGSAELRALRAKVAAVEALCDKATNTPGYNAHLPAFVTRVRAAISGPVDDA